MDTLNLAISLNKVFWTIIAGLLALISFLATIIWKNITQQLSEVKKMSTDLSHKMDRSQKNMLVNINSIQIQQARQDSQIENINKNNSMIQLNLRQLNDHIDNLPLSLLKVLNQKKN